MKIFITPLVIFWSVSSFSLDLFWFHNPAGLQFLQKIDELVENKHDGTAITKVISDVSKFIEYRKIADLDFRFYFREYPSMFLKKIGAKIRENKWDINGDENDRKSTPLMRLLSASRPPTEIKIALAAGADPNIKDQNFSESPLCLQ